MSFASTAGQPAPDLPSSATIHGSTSRAANLLHAATALLPYLGRGEALDAATLRNVMTEAFGANDAQGAWLWKDAYEACEAAQLLFLRRYLSAMRARASSPAHLLAMIARIAALTPTHTRRSEESLTLQQFSTPIELGFIARVAAGITAGDTVLEPSAGTGLLAIFAEAGGAALALNEIADTRADLLSLLFPAADVTRFNAEQIHDYLPDNVQPSVVMMNPPFSASLNVKATIAGTDLRHIRSALLRLPSGGRLVAITSAQSHPQAIPDMTLLGRVVFTAPIAGALYRRHGTTIETRLTVIDRTTDEHPVSAIASLPPAQSAEELLASVIENVPPRLSLHIRPVAALPAHRSPPPRPVPNRTLHQPPRPVRTDAPIIELRYTCREPDTALPAAFSDTLYEPYQTETVDIDGAHSHPTKLVQSAAMAAVRPPATSLPSASAASCCA
ncbi:hypothetical protein ACO2I3_19185 [Leptospira interrogans]